MESQERETVHAEGARKGAAYRSPAYRGPADRENAKQRGACAAVYAKHDLRQRCKPKGKGPALAVQTPRRTAPLALSEVWTDGSDGACRFEGFLPQRSETDDLSPAPAVYHKSRSTVYRRHRSPKLAGIHPRARDAAGTGAKPAGNGRAPKPR